MCENILFCTRRVFLAVSTSTCTYGMPRSGSALLADGACAGHRSFGLDLLTVHGIMPSAAMTVLLL